MFYLTIYYDTETAIVVGVICDEQSNIGHRWNRYGASTFHVWFHGIRNEMLIRQLPCDLCVKSTNVEKSRIWANWWLQFWKKMTSVNVKKKGGGSQNVLYQTYSEFVDSCLQYMEVSANHLANRHEPNSLYCLLGKSSEHHYSVVITLSLCALRASAFSTISIRRKV